MSAHGLRQIEMTTPRLRLRRLRQADAGLIALYANDARVACMTSRIPHPYPPGTAEAYLRRMLAPDAAEIVWALDAGTDEENGLIGLIGLTAEGADAAEVGYWVAPAYWGTGFAGEAVEAVADAAARTGLRALTAEVFQDNAASIRVLDRMGFEQVGVGEVHSVARGVMVPTLRYRRKLTS